MKAPCLCSRLVSLPAWLFFCYPLLLLEGFFLKAHLGLAEFMAKSTCRVLAEGGGRRPPTEFAEPGTE